MHNELTKNNTGSRDNQPLSGKEAYEFKKRNKRTAEEKRKKMVLMKGVPKKLLVYAAYVLVALGTTILIIWFVTSRPNLPPTTDINHSEDVPPSHILTKPMPDLTQRHMLEHADGRGQPGIIIQYNCTEFTCESGLVERLVEIVERHPDNVYLAPSSYDGRIILTKLGRRKILDELDEQAINEFIE